MILSCVLSCFFFFWCATPGLFLAPKLSRGAPDGNLVKQQWHYLNNKAKINIYIYIPLSADPMLTSKSAQRANQSLASIISIFFIIIISSERKRAELSIVSCKHVSGRNLPLRLVRGPMEDFPPVYEVGTGRLGV